MDNWIKYSIVVVLAMTTATGARLRGDEFDAFWVSAQNGKWEEDFRWSTFGFFLPFPNNDGDDVFNATISLEANPTVTFEQDLVLGDFTLAAGILSGDHSIRVDRTFNFDGGVAAGNGSILAIESMNWGGTNRAFVDFTVESRGTGQWTGGNVTGRAGTFVNDADADFELHFDAVWTHDNTNGAPASRFVNRGRFAKVDGRGATTMTVVLDNSGLVDVDSGGFRFNRSGRQDGRIEVAAGTSFDFARGFSFTSRSSIEGAGQIRFSSPAGSMDVRGRYAVGGSTTLTSGEVRFIPEVNLVDIGRRLSVFGGRIDLSTGEPIAIDTVSIIGGDLGGSSPLEVTNALTLTSDARISGSADFVTTGTTDILAGAETITFSRPVWANRGSVAWVNGDIALEGAQWRNEASGTIELYGASNLRDRLTGTPASLLNDGVFTKQIGNGISVFDVMVTNRNHFEILSGAVRFTKTYVQSAGTTFLSGGLSSTNAIRIEGGTLEGNGTITGVLANDAVLAIDQTQGSLSIDGEYHGSDSSRIRIGLPISPPTEAEAALKIGGTAILQGTLELRIADPERIQVGDEFTAIAYGARTGKFNRIDDGTLPDELRFRPAYETDSLRVTVVTKEEYPLALMGIEDLGDSIRITLSEEATPFQLQGTEDLLEGSWVDLDRDSPEIATIPKIDSRRFYRLVRRPL